MKRAVTTHRYTRDQAAALGLIATGRIYTEKIERSKAYRRIVIVEFRGSQWVVEYQTLKRVQPYSPQCAIPCNALGCEMIDYVIFPA